MKKKKMVYKKRKTGSLKKKALVCSTEAAAISIGIHLLLIVFAGSIVAMKYVQERGLHINVKNSNRPTLERRQLSLPVKVMDLQNVSRRPEIANRMVTPERAAVTLPSQMGLGSPEIAFDRGGSGLKSLGDMGVLPRLGFSGVKFFDRNLSKGEKMVFAFDASKNMVADERGAYVTYNFAKDRLTEMIAGINSATLFNVMFFTRDRTVMFRSTLIPATPENKNAAKEWYARVNDSAQVVGQIAGMSIPYEKTIEYEDSPVSDDASGWVTAVQAAMEQTADNIYVLCAGYDYNYINDTNWERLFGKSLSEEAEEEWLTSKGWSKEKREQVKRETARLKAKAVKVLAQENAAREKQGLAPKIIADEPAWWDYMKHDLNYQMPDRPPRMRAELGEGSYTAEMLTDHFDAVYAFNYKPKKLERPKIHIVKVIASDGNPVNRPGGEEETQWLINLKRIPQEFGGRFNLLRGAKTMEDLLKYNDISNE